MATGTCALFCLIICFLVRSSESQEIITADLGQNNVTLPCKVPNNNKSITAVKWIRPDQDPQYVLFYRDGRLDPHSQHPSYQNRVDLQDKEMKDGNFSLILRNVTMEDTGIYECRVFQGRKNKPVINITLVVRPSDVSLKDQPSDTLTTVYWTLGVVLIILLMVLFGLVYKIRPSRKRKTSNEWQEEREQTMVKSSEMEEAMVDSFKDQ